MSLHYTSFEDSTDRAVAMVEKLTASKEGPKRVLDESDKEKKYRGAINERKGW